ncbi:hypothetical protein G6F54_014274 [Rhizopus delemar]|nr:hypothetical protein G6F54_014274 [Rhizopus delemar]
MDKDNQVVAGNDPYAQRLAKITQGLANEDGLNLNFKVYRTADVNAWAMANGCVRVYTGLMDMASDDEVPRPRCARPCSPRLAARAWPPRAMAT